MPRLRLERFVPIARFAIVVAIELVGAHPMGPAAAQLHGPRQLGSSAARLIRDRTTIFRDDLRLGLRELLLGQGAIPFESSQSLQLFGEPCEADTRPPVLAAYAWLYAKNRSKIARVDEETSLLSQTEENPFDPHNGLEITKF